MKTAGIAYYTDGRLDPVIAQACRDQLQRAALGLPIASVTLVDPNYEQYETVWREPVWLAGGCYGVRGPLAMFRQILVGLEALDTDIAFMAEHDILYSAEHFRYRPSGREVYAYNRHVWKLRASDGHALHYPCDQTSGLCADRELLVAHYRKRAAYVEANGFSRRNGFEPGTRSIARGGFDDFPAETWFSAYPNVDIRHDSNLTASRWTKEAFRDQRYTAGWTEGDGVPGWGTTRGRFSEFLADLSARSEIRC